MLRLFASSLMFLAFTASRAPLAAQELSAEEKSAGFVSLFNGKDFTGWRFVSKGEDAKEAPNWLVKDGVIHLTGGGSPHLASDKEYGNFEMRFEWRALKEKYNSGFYIRSGVKLGSNQINLAKGAEGTLMYGKSKGGVGVPNLQKPAGEWNDWRVVVEGDKATFYCNGQKAWDATGLVPEKGYVGLQAEGAALEFRNLRIRELK
ncbi:MAG: DUF1080 domain-containing protein [Planctomycetaceae bacterium]|nr:DUF1080 domain-containing protein [Planctomycetaceae bacterium]